MAKKADTLADALQQVEADAELQRGREKEYALKAELVKSKKNEKALLGALEEQQIENSEMATELALYQKDFSNRPGWLKKESSRSKGHRATLVSFLSDMHYSEVVRPEEIGGYNKYNMSIAEIRTRANFERSIVVARNFLAGVEYDGIVLALGGDLVSGDIHEELSETNEFSVLRTTEMVLPWLAQGIEMFAEEFGRVHVVSAPGNHGRNSKKPRHKKRSENNADTHIAKLLATMLDNGDTITFDIPESADVDFDIYGYTFSMEHGDNLRFNGTSEIGSLGPVKRGNLRKTKKRQEQGRNFKYGLYGHFHQLVLAYTQGFVMNGSGKGYDEYASDGQFSPELAQQALLVVTPEHGITIGTGIILQDRDREGW